MHTLQSLHMTNDTEAILDDLLCRWAQWCRPVNVGRGYGHQALVCGQFRTSRQYDDANGALDEDLDHAMLKQVDYEISQIPQPENTALHAEGRRLVVGVDVYLSPRLPVDPVKRSELTGRARGLLVVRLGNAGVM